MDVGAFTRQKFTWVIIYGGISKWMMIDNVATALGRIWDCFIF